MRWVGWELPTADDFAPYRFNDSKLHYIDLSKIPDVSNSHKSKLVKIDSLSGHSYFYIQNYDS